MRINRTLGLALTAAVLAVAMTGCSNSASSTASSAASSEAVSSEAVSSEAASSEATAAPAAGDFDVDQDITVISREDGSGTRGAFEEIVGVEDACKYTNEYSSTGDVIGNVASNPSAIGYASLSAVQDQKGITVLTVGGVAPSEATVLDGSYAIQRPFVFATRTDEALSDAAQAFFDFATSTAASDLIANAGAVPVAQ